MASRRPLAGDDGQVPSAFWVAAIAIGVLALVGGPLDSRAAIAAATAIFLLGGLPHGAYDIALLRGAIDFGRRALILAVAGYVAVAVLMILLWLLAPVVALAVFLIVASVHFGQDWTMLDEPLLKVAAGVAVIAAPAIGHTAEVTALFVAMSDRAGGTIIAKILVATAPVALLVAGVAIAIAARQGAVTWAAATATAFVFLFVAPPVVGFALFFVFLHSPRHLADARARLSTMSRAAWWVTGGVMSALAIAGWIAATALLPQHFSANLTVQAFQLLAAVAVPHLVLSIAIERRLTAQRGVRPGAPL